MQKMCVVLCGGGTGGHIYPNLAIAEQITPFRRVCYIGNGGMEERLASDWGLEFFKINAPKFQRKITLQNAKLPISLFKSVNQSKKILKELAPAVIFSKGGYVALPVCLAGLSLGIPVLCHESDLSVGLANKLTYAMGGTLLTSFKPTMANKKRVIHVGSPLRKGFYPKSNSANNNNKSNGDTVSNLLVIGGSQGAKAINDAVISHLFELTEKFVITHITGAGKITPTAEIHRQYQNLPPKQLEHMLLRYNQIEYSSQMPQLYQNADFAISRGGANALFELLQCEVPTLVVPLEKGSRGDQVENAEYLSSKKLCHQLSENHLFGLCESLTALENAKSQIVANIKTTKQATPFDGRDNIVKLLLSHKGETAIIKA